MKNLVLVKIKSEYCDYLRKYDYRVPYNYDDKELRPFIGVVLEVNNLFYFAPLTSPKEKHKKMNEQIDFLKIKDGDLGGINFNNMIPLNSLDDIEYIDLNTKSSYTDLLNNQLRWLNRHINIVYNKSAYLYKAYINKRLPKRIIDRCCNFPFLEEKAKEYSKIVS